MDDEGLAILGVLHPFPVVSSRLVGEDVPVDKAAAPRALLELRDNAQVRGTRAEVADLRATLYTHARALDDAQKAKLAATGELGALPRRVADDLQQLLRGMSGTSRTYFVGKGRLIDNLFHKDRLRSIESFSFGYGEGLVRYAESGLPVMLDGRDIGETTNAPFHYQAGLYGVSLRTKKAYERNKTLALQPPVLAEVQL